MNRVLNWARIACGVLVAFGFVNFPLFVIIHLILGGDAWGGKVEAGRYYLSMNGRLTEVSRPVFQYSYVHCVVTMGSAAFAVIGGIILRHYEDKRESRNASNPQPQAS